MKNLLMKIPGVRYFMTVLALALSSVVSVANAALPTVVTDETTGAFAVLTADFLELLDLIWPLAVTFTVAFIILRMFKKGASVATS